MSVLDSLDIESCFEVARLKQYIYRLQQENSELRIKLGMPRKNERKIQIIDVIVKNPGLSQRQLAKLAKCSRTWIQSIQQELNK